VLHEGRLVWVVDLFTTTSRYPYGQEADTDQLRSGSGLDRNFNYVRNSVKATVDAYDGTVEFYAMPVDDPIRDAYRDAFPDLFSDYDAMPDNIKDHLRYPEDLFRVQTAAYARYHRTDPDDFFNQDDTWRVARDPGTAGADPTTQVTDASGQATGATTAPRISPYYQVLQLPPAQGEPTSAEPEMVLMRPFVPFSEDDQRQQLRAFMAARMDADHYGELVAYEMPSDELPEGPGIVASSIQADEDVSNLETVLGRGGSEVRYGNLLLVPVDNALLYVQPFYVVAENEARQVPLIERVIAVFGDEVVISDTLSEAMEELFGAPVDTQERPDEEGGEADGEADTDGDAPSGTVSEQVANLLDEAQTLFDQADEALTERDLATFEERVAEARAKMDEAADLITGDAGSGDGGSGDAESGDTGSDDEGTAAGSTSGRSSGGGTTTTTRAADAAGGGGDGDIDTTPA
jgi:hypothetical protein